jgi:colanic acid biosynthesis glycosyl transferase WcaI
MKVLVLCAAYHPEVTALGPFNTDLCTFLAEQGHQVTAVVAFPHYPEWEKAEAYRGINFSREIHRGVDVIRTPMYIPRRPTPMRRIAYDSSFAASALVAGAFFGGSPDVIVAMCSPLQAGASAALLGLARRAPFVFHLQDLLPDGAVALGMLRNPVAIALAEGLGRAIYARADRVTAIGAGFLDALARKGVDREKLVYLPNWVDTNWIRPQTRMNAFRARSHAGEDVFLVGYTGNFGIKQQMETVVEAARLLRDRRDIRFVLVGDGARKQEAVELAADARLENLELLGVQPRESLPEMLAAMDVLILHQRKAVVDMVVPSKLLTYAASGRPILFAGVPESEGAKFVTDAEAGVVIAPENPNLLAHAIVEMQADRIKRDEFGQNGRRYVEAHFDREHILATAEALLREVAGRRKPATRFPGWAHR